MPIDEAVSDDDDLTLLIGTCRVKRPRAFLSPERRRHIRLLRSHVHYPREILQMLRYVRGEIDLPLALTPLLIDDVNNGNIESLEQLAERREEARAALEASSRVVLEISSLKRIHISGEELVANITSVSNLKRGRVVTDFIDIGAATAMADSCEVERYSEREFVDDVRAILSLLDRRHVTLVSHFRATVPATGNVIEERVTLGRWLAASARVCGCDFLDQSDLVERLGESVALKDTSHYSERGEREMARMLESLVDGDGGTERFAA